MAADDILRGGLIAAGGVALVVECVGLATDGVTISSQVRQWVAKAPVESGVAFVLGAVWFTSHIWDSAEVWVPWVADRYGYPEGE